MSFVDDSSSVSIGAYSVRQSLFALFHSLFVRNFVSDSDDRLKKFRKV